jgi:phage shock protein C
MKKIYLSKTNKKWLGVFGGLGEYFEVDPTILRLLWIFLFVFTGFLPGFIVYLFAYFVMPEHPNQPHMHDEQHKKEVAK